MSDINSFIPTRGEDEWLGIAIFNREAYALVGLLGEFIPDYRAYDPEGSAKESAKQFRGGVLTLSVDTASRFLNAMKARLLTLEQVELLASTTDQVELVFLVDFDSKTYVHSYYDLAMESYCPKGWTCRMGGPQRELKRILRSWRS